MAKSGHPHGQKIDEKALANQRMGISLATRDGAPRNKTVGYACPWLVLKRFIYKF